MEVPSGHRIEGWPADRTQLGLTSDQTLAQWESDIAQAQSAGLDGFALNAGPSDQFGDQQLALAYQAAEAAGFKLFVSFDMVRFPPQWPTPPVPSPQSPPQSQPLIRLRSAGMLWFVGCRQDCAVDQPVQGF